MKAQLQHSQLRWGKRMQPFGLLDWVPASKCSQFDCIVNDEAIASAAYRTAMARREAYRVKRAR